MRTCPPSPCRHVYIENKAVTTRCMVLLVQLRPTRDGLLLVTKPCLVVTDWIIFKCLTMFSSQYFCSLLFNLCGLEFSFSSTFSVSLWSDQPHCLRAGYTSKWTWQWTHTLICLYYTGCLRTYCHVQICLSYSPSVNCAPHMNGPGGHEQMTRFMSHWFSQPRRCGKSNFGIIDCFPACVSEIYLVC